MIAKTLTAWVEVAVIPVAGDPFTHRVSTRPLSHPPSFYGGRKRKEVISFGDVERALSDVQGAPEISTFTFEVEDRSGFWRGLLANPDTVYLTGSDITYYLLSEEGTVLMVEPRTGFRGQLDAPKLLGGRRFQVNGQSRLGTRLGPLNMDGACLKRAYNPVSEGGDFSDATFPRDSWGKAVRFLWGEKTDKGRVNTEDVSIEKGTMALTNCGKVFLGSTPGTPPTVPTYLPNPPAPTFLQVGAGGTYTFTFGCSIRTVNGGHTAMGGTLTVTGLPANGAWTNGISAGANSYPVNGGVFSLAPYSATLMVQVAGVDLWVKEGAVDSVFDWHRVDAAGQMFNSTANEYFSGPVGYMANGDDRFDKASPDPPGTNTAMLVPVTVGTDPASFFYTFWGFTGIKSRITTLYGSSLTEDAKYVGIGLDKIGTDWSSGKPILLGPDLDGYKLDLAGPDGATHSYWGVMAKGELNDAAESGSFPFRVNGCGVPEIEDIGTAPILIAADARDGRYLDTVWKMGWGDMPGPPGPTAVTITEVPGGAIGPSVLSSVLATMVWGVTAGIEGNPFPFKEGDRTVTLSGTGKQITVGWTWGGANPTTWRIALGAVYFGSRWQQILEVPGSARTVTFDNNPNYGGTGGAVATGTQVTTFYGRRSYRVLAVMAGGRTGPSTRAVTIEEAYKRKVHVTWLPVAGALSYEVYGSEAAYPYNADYNRRWAVPTSQIDSNGYIYVDDDWNETGVTFVSGLPMGTLGTGAAIIDQAALVYLSVFTQLLGNEQRGYESGALLTIPMFPNSPVIPMFEGPKFFAVQEITKLYLSDDKGYIACVDLDSFDWTWGSFIQQMWVDFFFDYGENHHGEGMITIMDDTQLPTDGQLFRQFTHFKTIDDPGEVAEDSIRNYVTYEFEETEGEYASGIKTIQDDLSVRKLGKRDEHFQKKFTRDPATAFDSAGRLLADRATGPMYPAGTFKLRKAMQVELGTQIRFQHEDLVVPEPIPIYVRRFRHSYEGASVSLVGRDRRGTYALLIAPDATVGTNSGDAPPAELMAYAFATDDNGLLPDGSLGPRVR